jgi:hypothetical protein
VQPFQTIWQREGRRGRCNHEWVRYLQGWAKPKAKATCRVRLQSRLSSDLRSDGRHFCSLARYHFALVSSAGEPHNVLQPRAVPFIPYGGRACPPADFSPMQLISKGCFRFGSEIFLSGQRSFLLRHRQTVYITGGGGAAPGGNIWNSPPQTAQKLAKINGQW